MSEKPSFVGMIVYSVFCLLIGSLVIAPLATTTRAAFFKPEPTSRPADSTFSLLVEYQGKAEIQEDGLRFNVGYSDPKTDWGWSAPLVTVKYEGREIAAILPEGIPYPPPGAIGNLYIANDPNEKDGRPVNLFMPPWKILATRPASQPSTQGG